MNGLKFVFCEGKDDLAVVKGLAGSIGVTDLQIEPSTDPLIAFAQDLVNRSDHHLSRNRIDCRLPNRHLQAGLSNQSNPLASLKDNDTEIVSADACKDPGPMSLIRIIPAVFYHLSVSRIAGFALDPIDRDREEVQAIGQSDIHFLWILVTEQCEQSCFDRRRGARAGGIASSQPGIC